MALVRDHTLFSELWQQGLRAVPESGMAAKIAVYVREVTYVNNAPTVVKTYVYGNTSGAKARVQPLGTATKAEEVGDTTFVQRVLFSIPLGGNTGTLNPESMFVDVIESELNPELVGPVFVLREVVDSSNPIERTFIGEVDTSG